MAQPDPAPVVDLESLAVRYRGALHRFFHKRIATPADIDDLVQDVFLRLARRGLDDIHNVEGYLFETAANVLRDRRRVHVTHRADYHHELDPNHAQDEVASPERVLQGKEAIAQMENALKELPERTQRVFILARYQDLQHVDIAQRLGISRSAVEKHMMKAIEFLATRLEDIS